MITAYRKLLDSSQVPPLLAIPMQETQMWYGCFIGLRPRWFHADIWESLAQMTSMFEGQPPKTRPKFQSKQGSFGFQVYIYIHIL